MRSMNSWAARVPRLTQCSIPHPKAVSYTRQTPSKLMVELLHSQIIQWLFPLFRWEPWAILASHTWCYSSGQRCLACLTVWSSAFLSNQYCVTFLWYYLKILFLFFQFYVVLFLGLQLTVRTITYFTECHLDISSLLPPSTTHSDHCIADSLPCAELHTPVTILWSPTVLPTPATSFTQAPSPSLLWQPPVCSLCRWGCFNFTYCSLDSTCKWNHMVYVFLWLTYSTQHNAL